MKSTVVRSAIVSAVITAVLVSALGLWAVPKFVSPHPPQVAQADDTVMQPAVYDRPSPANSDRPVSTTRARARATPPQPTPTQPITTGLSATPTASRFVITAPPRSRR